MIGNLDLGNLKQNEAIRLGKETEDINTIIALSKHSNPTVRKSSLFQMCPCRVKGEIDRFWDRVFEMANDPDPIVRAQVLHTICDGSPKHLELKVIQAVQDFNVDSDKTIRRKAHKVLASYHRTGKWNIL
jgi:hypothetical protein